MKKYFIPVGIVLSALIAKAQTGEIHIDEPVDGITTPFSQRKVVDTVEIYVSVQKSAEFPGGMDHFTEYLQQHSKYPIVTKNQPSKKVYLTFVVQMDGTISDIRILRYTDQELEAEALRLIKTSPRWSPGEINGHKVKQQYTIPISFAQN